MTNQQPERRVAVLVAPGLEEIEGLTVVDLLFRAKVPCDTVAVAPDRTVTSSHGVMIVCDRCIEDTDLDLAAYELVVLPGGIPGTPNLAASEAVTSELERRMANGLPVAAICAAPTVLANLGLLEGRKATCYPDMQHVLAEHGATVEPGRVVVDGNLTTSCGMGTAIDFGLELVAQLCSRDEADRISRGIVYAS